MKKLLLISLILCSFFGKDALCAQTPNCDYVGKQNIFKLNGTEEVKKKCDGKSIPESCASKDLTVCRVGILCDGPLPSKNQHSLSPQASSYEVICLAVNGKCPDNPTNCANDKTFQFLSEDN